MLTTYFKRLGCEKQEGNGWRFVGFVLSVGNKIFNALYMLVAGLIGREVGYTEGGENSSRKGYMIKDQQG